MRQPFISILFVLISLGTAQAQNQGSVSGNVTDVKTGEALIGVTVRVLDTQLGAVTDANGFYTIANIPATTYSVQASYIGYENQTKFNVVIRSGGIPDVNFQLEETTTQLTDVVITASPFEEARRNPLIYPAALRRRDCYLPRRQQRYCQGGAVATGSGRLGGRF